MWSNVEHTIRQYAGRTTQSDIRLSTAVQERVVIRAARDADLPLLADLAELDSARPLTGSVLVAVVDGTPVAALSVQSDRAIADPFRATAAAVELLRLRARQLRATEPRPQRRLRRRWIADRARA